MRNRADVVADQLGYREKLHLAQRLLQMAIKEEEAQTLESAGPVDPGMVESVAERLRKLKPSRKDAVLNSIGAMFQFRGGIPEQDKETMFAALVTAQARRPVCDSRGERSPASVLLGRRGGRSREWKRGRWRVPVARPGLVQVDS